MVTAAKLIATSILLLSFETAKAEPVEIVLRPSDLIIRGNQYISASEIESAKVVFNKALRSNLTTEQRANAYNGLCVAHIKQENWLEAMALCNASIEHAPHNWRYYNNRGNVHLGLGQYKKAMVDYEKALAFAPKSATIQKNMALASMHLEKDANDNVR